MEGKGKLLISKTPWHIINFKLEFGPNRKSFLFTMFYLLMHPYRQNVTRQKHWAASLLFTLERCKEFGQG